MVTRIEPFEPILTITHFVRIPFLSNSFPASIGFPMPVNDSAWHIINVTELNQNCSK
jgi:hypothetical protein